MKKILSFMIMLALLLTATLSVSAVVHNYGINVNGVLITENNAANVLGDGTVSYDPATNTLTLNGANITEYCDIVGFLNNEETTHHGIYANVPELKIKLMGENKITTDPEPDEDIYKEDGGVAIACTGDLEIFGDGKLDVIAWTGVAVCGDILAQACEMSFSNAALTSRSGNVNLKDFSFSSRNGAVTAVNGNIVLDNVIASDKGMGTASSIVTMQGNISVKDSDITAVSSVALGTMGNGGSISVNNTKLDAKGMMGIYAVNGDIYLEGVSGKIDARSEEFAATIRATADITLKDCELDIYCSAADGGAFGIATEGDVKIEGSKLDMEVRGVAVQPIFSMGRDVEIGDSEIDMLAAANSEDSCGIGAFGNVKIDGSKLKLDIRGYEFVFAIGNMFGGGDSLITDSELDLTVSGLTAVGIVGDNSKLDGCTATVKATAGTDPESFAAGVAAFAGIVRISGGSLNATANGPANGELPSAAIMVYQPESRPEIINADVTLRGNVATNALPDLTPYTKSHLIKAFTGSLMDTPIEYTPENLANITCLRIYPLCSIAFDANGGTGNLAGVEEHYGEYELPENPFTAPEGKRFKGWSLKADGEVLGGESFIHVSDVTLYAIWEDIPHEHSFGAEWKTDADVHYNECECGEKANTAAHADSDGNGKCDVCQYVMSTDSGNADGSGDTDIPDATAPHEHSYGSEWQTEEGKHFKSCSCGERTLEGEHVDENENGSCDICGSPIEKEGCGGVIGGAAALVAVVMGTGMCLLSKKREDI